MYEPLYSAEEMRAAEERYPGYPDTADELMERAGTAVAEELLLAYPDARRVTAVCGKGANGGDGRIAARVLREAGVDAGEADGAAALASADVIVDALFGTGFRGAPRPEAAALIEGINDAGAPVVAVDLPSGVDASTGEVAGVAVRADLTVTFHAAKTGLHVAPGRDHVGRIVVRDIGLRGADTAGRLATPGVLRRVPLRSGADTKYTAGHVVVVGGSQGMTGAAALTATAALRADAGYVTLCVPVQALPAAEALAVEPVKRSFGWDDGLEVVLEAAGRAGSLAMGPGLGRSPEAARLVRDLLARSTVPAVVDADALYDLEPFDRATDAPIVLTPHAGELARLLGSESAAVREHRLSAACEAAGRYRCTVLLKGPDTIVASPDGSFTVCAEGPPSLATAGTGDVLTGVIAAFLAKGLDPVDAAVAGAVAHGLAAQAAPHRAGLVASDLTAALPGVLDAHCLPRAAT